MYVPEVEVRVHPRTKRVLEDKTDRLMEGNGGKGGNVVLVVDESLNTLAGLTHAWRPNAFGGSGASYKTANEGSRAPKSFAQKMVLMEVDNRYFGKNARPNKIRS